MAKLNSTPATAQSGATTVARKPHVPPLPKGAKVNNRGVNPKKIDTPRTVAIFGTYGTGKSILAAALSLYVPVIYFDLESGVQSILSEGNKDRVNLKNLTIQPIYDTIEEPLAAGLMKSLLGGKTVAICAKHGRQYGDCHVCKDDEFNIYNLSELGTEQDSPIVVVDSGTQMDMSLRTKVYGSKMNKAWDGDVDSSFHDWRRLGALWDYFGSEIQTAHLKGYRIVMIFHEVEKGNKVMPLVGTKDYAPSFGKFWGSVLRTSVDTATGKYKIQCTAEGGRGHCKNRAFLPEGSIQEAKDIFKLF